MKYESGKNNINAMFGVINYSNQSSLNLDEVYEKLKTPYQEYYKAFDKCQKYVNDINSSDDFNTKIMLFDYSMLSALKMVNPKNLEYINLEYLKNKCRENSLQDKASHIISYIDTSVSGMSILNEPYKNGGAIMSDESYGKKAYIIGISRDFAQNYEINLFGQNELVKKYDLKEEDFIKDCFFHEIGHGLLNKPDSFYNPYEKYVKECEADAFATFVGIKEKGNTNLAKIIKNIRVLSFEKLSVRTKEDSKHSKNLEKKILENETHYTCDVIDGIIKFADKKLKEDKNFFDKMSIKELSTLSLSLVQESKLSYDDFKDIAKGIIKEENDGNASYNSYLSHVKNAKVNVSENSNKNPSITLDEYKKHLKNESKKIDCDNFTVSFIDFINREKKELLKNDSPIRFNETLDSDYVFKSDKVMAFVVLNSFIENDDKEINPTSDNFIKETNQYYQNMEKLIKDIQNDKVSSESLNHFKKAINHYYKSFEISNKLNKEEIANDNLRQEITKTFANPIPKEMEKMFFNDKTSLNNVLKQKADFEKSFATPKIILNTNQKNL